MEDRTSKKLPEIDWARVDQLIKLALEEDLSSKGDVTSNSVIPPVLEARAVLKCKQDCVCAGIAVAEKVFLQVDGTLNWKKNSNDGDFCPSGTIMAEVSGKAISLLTAERTALNFLQRLCGIATAARTCVEKASPGKAKILDTRKTTPGWRNLEKYAVAAGGAQNHRMGLYDMVMIKDNHVKLAGLTFENGIGEAVKRAREKYPELKIEVEADTLEQVETALKANADYILLDNMSNEEMKKAVEMTDGRALLEASGGITAERLSSAASTGVDFISLGALTHSVSSADISMEIEAVN